MGQLSGGECLFGDCLELSAYLEKGPRLKLMLKLMPTLTPKLMFKTGSSKPVPNRQSPRV